MRNTKGTPAKGKVVKGLKTLTPGKSLTQHESRQELLTDDSPKVKKRKSYDKPLPKPPDKNDFIETKRSSVASLLPSLATNEEKFFSLVEDGNVASVMQFLKEQKDFNINCCNYWGYTVLVVATKQEDIAMVKYLLQFDTIYVGDALLHAVLVGNKDLVQLFLDVNRLQSKDSVNPLPNDQGSVDFTSDITPLVLAAHCNDFEMIGFLMKRGQRLDKPHPPSCFCEERCKKRLTGESLGASMARYNRYRAWASPAFLARTSSDPILTAFKLSKELDDCAANERELKKLYLALADECRAYAVALLAECRTTPEVQLLLNRREGNDRNASNRNAKFSRVQLALDYDQPEFLAHHNAQQVMRASWLEGFHDWRSLNLITKLMRLLPHMLFLPIMALIYFIMPKCRISKGWSTPLNKFFSFVTSYIIFLAIMLLQAFLNKDNALRGAPKTGLEWFIILYVTGLAWMNIKLAWYHGIRWFFMYKWNVFDLVTITTFYCAFVCWGWSEYLITRMPDARHLPRNHWGQYDPMLLGEAFYAWANLFALLRLMFFFQISNTIGPLQVSLSRMVNSILVFLVLFMLHLVAFAIGLYQIYHHYTDQYKMVEGEVVRQYKTFANPISAVHTLYWSLYGYYPPVVTNIVVADTLKTVNNKTTLVPNHHGFTEVAGHTMFAVYYVVAIIVLINVLIAMLSHVFTIVQENDDVEWKFARCQVWMRFFHHGSTLPPPFNLVPTPKFFIRIFLWLIYKLSCRKSAKFSLYELIVRLVQRHLTRLEREKSDRSTNLSDLDNIKNEIKELQTKMTMSYV